MHFLKRKKERVKEGREGKKKRDVHWWKKRQIYWEVNKIFPNLSVGNIWRVQKKKRNKERYITKKGNRRDSNAEKIINIKKSK